jgi:hypothetical protein
MSTATLVRTVTACPVHGLPLSGGPVLWHCDAGLHGHGVQAADLQQEVQS